MTRKKEPKIRPTAWDAAVFGFDTFELASADERVLKSAKKPGHYTVKVDPFSSKKALYEQGFYYCDTLVEPYCDRGHFQPHYDVRAAVSRDAALIPDAYLCRQSFVGRFHRDFNLDRNAADRRYLQWLRQLIRSQKVFALLFRGRCVGFLGHERGKIRLHALDKKIRGKGLSKFLWTRACLEIFKSGSKEITSSISLSNMPVLNLYVSLGFRFRNPRDVYHKRIGARPRGR